MTTTTRWARARATGSALRRSAPSQKILARVLGMNERDLSRQINGYRASVVSEYHDWIRRLVQDPKCDPGALIAESIAVAVDEASRLPEPEIVERYNREMDTEQHAQACEDETTHRVIRALARARSPLATKEDRAECRAAMEAQDDALSGELGPEINVLIYNRALRLVWGWA